MPLARFYLLSEGRKIGIARLHPQIAFMAIMRHGLDALATCGALVQSTFVRCATLAASAPVSRLERPLFFSELDQVIRLLESDLASCPAFTGRGA
jgi:hypothetical protein